MANVEDFRGKVNDPRDPAGILDIRLPTLFGKSRAQLPRRNDDRLHSLEPFRIESNHSIRNGSARMALIAAYAAIRREAGESLRGAEAQFDRVSTIKLDTL